MRNRPNMPVVPGAPPTPGAKPPGGASGAPFTGPSTATPAISSLGPRPAGPKSKRFRVKNGGFVVFNGCRTAIRAGKEVSDTQYDIAHLRRQGIVLEAIEDPSEVPEPAPVAIDAPPAPVTAAE